MILMMLRSLLFSLFLSLVFFSCSNPKQIEETEEIPEIPEIIECVTENLQITENDSIAIPNPINPVVWKGFYNSQSVEIHFTEKISTDDETEKFSILFSKKDNCLKIERAFKFYDGNQVAISAVTEVTILDFAIQSYTIDEQFSGMIRYLDPHDKEIYTLKFWTKLKQEDSENEPQETILFETCFGNKLPIDIDVNKDNQSDFQLTFEEKKDIGNIPKFSYFTIKLIPTNTTTNFILSQISTKSPFILVFEPPFSSENAKYYAEEVKNELDVFYQFEAPYENYNYFLNNKLTYRKILSNNLKDYFVVSLIINGKQHFGWIQFELNTDSCKVLIVETYFNPVPDNPVFVN